MSQTTAIPVLTTQVDQLAVRVYADRAAMGAAAGADVVAALRERLARQERVRMIFAAAPSQNETLAALGAAADIDWSRVTALHMDEYLGLPAGAPERFGSYLREHLFDRVQPGEVAFIAPQEIADDDDAAAEAECARYAALVRAAPVDIVCLGIGENGHIAFNDPPVANFADPRIIKPVELDAACRQQQVNDGCFPKLAAVPRRALTLTIPALYSGAQLFCSVPGPTKRAAVRATLTGAIATTCPASILRRHPACTLYTDAAGYGDVVAL
jgi:glucosamine-6-phosphate deaminase